MYATTSIPNPSPQQSLGANAIPVPKTIGEELDRRIAICRKELEATCVLKAKAEAMQMLNYPLDFIRSLSYS